LEAAGKMVIQLALATPCKVRGIELVETRHLEECLKMLRRLSQVKLLTESSLNMAI
jgi:hypothetical protein